MNSRRDDAAGTTRANKVAGARRHEDQAGELGPFQGMLAGVIAPPNVQNTGTLPTDARTGSSAVAPTVSDKSANLASEAGPKEVSKGEPKSDTKTDTASGSAKNVGSAHTDGTQVQTTTGTVGAATGQDVSEAANLLAQLAALGVDEGVQQQPTTTTTSNAAVVSNGRSNVGAAAVLQNSAASGLAAEVAQTAVTPTESTAAIVANENGALTGSPKAKLALLEATVKVPNQAVEPVSTTLDGAGSSAVIDGTEVAIPANDQASRAPSLTPHTIPMLAATMMRRLESGARQFTMRLDPPELGQVEVKLTVAADKKVRAVVSADRPEALADLVRSARDLARALQEAGLDLDENGLTFTLNDPSSGGQQHNQARDQQHASVRSNSAHHSTAADPEVTSSAAKMPSRNDPFQSWQRARIVLTA